MQHQAHSHQTVHNTRTPALSVADAATHHTRRFGAARGDDKRVPPRLAEEEVVVDRHFDHRVIVCRTHAHTLPSALRCKFERVRHAEKRVASAPAAPRRLY